MSFSMKAEDIINAHNISHRLPGEMIEAIGRNLNIQGPDLYRELMNVLCDKSFGNEILMFKDEVIQVMSEMEKQLLGANMQTRQLKIVLDIANLHKVNREQEYRLVYEAAFVCLMYIHIMRHNIHAAPSGITFYQSYPEIFAIFSNTKEFQGNDIGEYEQRKLLSFANFMRISLLLMQKPKKAHLLDLVTRISEGKMAKYITGSGQTHFTSRRVHIFEYESGKYIIIKHYHHFTRLLSRCETSTSSPS